MKTRKKGQKTLDFREKTPFFGHFWPFFGVFSKKTPFLALFWPQKWGVPGDGSADGALPIAPLAAEFRTQVTQQKNSEHRKKQNKMKNIN